MFNLGYFLGGAVSGAAGLFAAPFRLRRDCAEVKVNVRFSAAEAAMMNAREVIGHLDKYSWKAGELSLKCTKLNMEASNYFLGPVELPDDDILRLGKNKLEYLVVRGARPLHESCLRDMKALVVKLYAQYRPVFARGNELLKAARMPGVGIDCASLQPEIDLDNSMANADWGSDFARQCEILCDFLENSGNAGSALIEQLERFEKYGSGQPLALSN